MLVDLCDDQGDQKNLAVTSGKNVNLRNYNAIKIDISHDDEVKVQRNRDNDAIYILDDPPEAVSDGVVDPILIETDLVCLANGEYEGRVTSQSNSDAAADTDRGAARSGRGGVAAMDDVILLDVDDSDADIAHHQIGRDISCAPSSSSSSSGEYVSMHKSEFFDPLHTSGSTASDVHVDVLVDVEVGNAPITTKGNQDGTTDHLIPSGEVIVNESLNTTLRDGMTDMNQISTLESSTKDTDVYESDLQLTRTSDQCAPDTAAVEMVEIVDDNAGHGSVSKYTSYESHCLDLSEDASQGEGILTLETGANHGSGLSDEQIVIIGEGEELALIEDITSSTRSNNDNGTIVIINDNDYNCSSSSSSSGSKRNASRRRTSSSTSTSSPTEHSIATPPEDESRIVLRCILQEIVEKSGLLRLLDTELRNESFLDIDNHSELYYLVYQVCSA